LQKAYRLIGIGDDLASQKKIDLAIKSYKDGVALAPEKEELRYGLALVLFLNGKEDEALPVFKQVFAENPVWVEITKRYVASGDLPNDPKKIQRILEQAPLKTNK
jgi:tetratricopeptide (TPR) repeat protein